MGTVYGREHVQEAIGVMESLDFGRPQDIHILDKRDLCAEIMLPQAIIDLVQQEEIPVRGARLLTCRTFTVVVEAIRKPDMDEIDQRMLLSESDYILRDQPPCRRVRVAEVRV